MKKTRLLAEIAVTFVFMSLLFISTVSSAGTATATIGSSGTIVVTSTASPLHVDGNKIKDANGNVVYLRGVNKPQFESSADGWMGTTIWNDDRVKQELDIMKSWGINIIRVHISVDVWKNNWYTGGIYDRTAIQRLVQFAAERGIYVVLSGYSVYRDGFGQDALPYPPYQYVPQAQNIIGNVQQFIDWWVDVASTLRSYPNVLIDVWNEPHGDLSTWFPTVQSVINALRANGLNNIVVVQRGWCASIDLSTPTNLGNDLSWITNNPLADPAGNIVYETHLYREYDHIIYSSPQKRQVYTLADIDTGFRLMKYYDIAAQYPLYIGEIGCANDASDLDNERAFFANALSLLNQHGISYTAWMWGDWTNDHLHTGAPAFTPTAAGTILRSYLGSTPARVDNIQDRRIVRIKLIPM